MGVELFRMLDLHQNVPEKNVAMTRLTVNAVGNESHRCIDVEKLLTIERCRSKFLSFVTLTRNKRKKAKFEPSVADFATLCWVWSRAAGAIAVAAAAVGAPQPLTV